jgi:hypothetical protein
MGDAGNAAKGLLDQSRDRQLLRGYIGGWNSEQVVTGAGSKNIPLLRFAHDMVEADRKVDLTTLNRGFNALHGYFAACKKHGHFLGEEYSTIYWRWIVIPVQIVKEVAQRHGRHTIVSQADQWLRDFIVINALGAWPVLTYAQSDRAKNPGRALYGMPTSSIGMARAWVMNKGDNNKRDIDDSMSWVDATSHAPWLAWMLGRGGIGQLTGGDNWVANVLKGFDEIYGIIPPLSQVDERDLFDAVYGGEFPYDLVSQIQYGPSKPMMIGRTTQGTWTVGEDSFTDGSTSFMHVKSFFADTSAYETDSIANPLKRSNRDPGKAFVSPDFTEVVLQAADNTIWDWDKEKEVPGEVTVDLPGGELLWVVRIRKDSHMVLHPQAPKPPVPVDDYLPWYKRLIQKIFSWF